MNKQKYLLEYTWGENNPMHEEIEIETDDINWTMDQISRHRNNIKFTKVIKL
jgi:hypothetical protein